MDTQVKAKEEELLAAFRNGDMSAFDGLVELYSAKLYRVAYMLLENKQDAEEVVQDAFIRAYKAFPSFRGDSSFETWMHRITMNLARNRFHWNKRRGMGLHISLSAPQLNDPDQTGPQQDIDLPDVTMQPDQELETHELENDIAAIINALPEKFRESLLLRHQQEMSYEAIALATGVPINTVKTRIKRARELLKEGLTQLEYDNRKKHRFHVKD
ncbi:MAG: sigma-70 family RNA polymerase sigma factor [Lentisphaeria bacterium]|nr:sigma-70 family RNA polymerase sigma factor [Lentisphaeria bacterium]